MRDNCIYLLGGIKASASKSLMLIGRWTSSCREKQVLQSTFLVGFFTSAALVARLGLVTANYERWPSTGLQKCKKITDESFWLDAIGGGVIECRLILRKGLTDHGSAFSKTGFLFL